MNKTIYIRQLMIPIWPLYNVEKITDVRFTKKGADRFVDVYSENSIRYLYQALNWVKENPGYDFLDYQHCTLRFIKLDLTL